jgi:type IV pilus assembly protein PilY1
MKHLSTSSLLLGLLTFPCLALGFDLSNSPLFVTGGVPSNVIVTLDTSSSMFSAHTPDSPNGGKNTKRYTSAKSNPMYYNPKTEYPPPYKFDGSLASTSFTAAYLNGFNTALPTVNLGQNYAVTTRYPPEGSAQEYSTLVNPFATGTTHTDTGTTQGTNSGSNAPWFSITDFVNADGSASGNDPGTNLVSVTVNGNTRTYDGTYSGTCSNTVDSSEETKFKTQISGNTLTLCFNDKNSNYGKPITVVHRDSAGANPAFYYLWYADTIPATSKPASCDDTTTDDDCYIAIQVGSTGDIYKNEDGSAATEAQKKQNFANWYSFYRIRTLALMSAADLAFWDMSSDIRLAWQTLEGCIDFTGTNCVGVSGTNYPNYIKQFDGTHRSNFFKWLFDINSWSGTPLRSAAKRAGDYFSTTSGVNNPYAEFPQDSVGTEYSCRKNFHILMTDGQWNGDTALDTWGNTDGANLTLPDGSVYTAAASGDPESGSAPFRHPFDDSNEDMLADILFHYWATDLRTDLENNVLPLLVDKSGATAAQYVNAKNDPATWQHMVTFTVGLGLTSSLTNPVWNGSTYEGDYNNLVSGIKTWPSGKVYDLWHGALNSRGQFFSVEDPNALATSFKKILQTIEDATPSASALAANSTSLDLGTRVYQAKFNTSDWSGHLYAYDVDTTSGTLSDDDGDGTLEAWDAAAALPAHGSRNIYVNDGSASPVGVAFQWANLTEDQKDFLNVNLGGSTNGSGRVDWLRGNSSGEVLSGGVFRDRSADSKLGDIVSSDPAYIGSASEGYDELLAGAPGQSTYAAFLSYKGARTGSIVVGANDGMLHAFRADTGAEVMAVIPDGVFPKLAQLTDPTYLHSYFVDASPGTGDAYLNNSLSHAGSGWNTVVVAGLGGGGNSVFAVDMTSTTTASPNQFMWEYTDGDMGYTFSQPQVGRLHGSTSAGYWAAVFGNGYKESGGGAYLYIIDLSDGSLIRKIQAGTDTDNGLSTPVLVDTNNDKVIDYAYAGDLQGNLWKFDLSHADKDEWSASNMFIAMDPDDNRQPITVKPVVASEASGGHWIFFGTGRYFATDDNTSTGVQSFYGIWDNGAVVPAYTDRTDILVEQEVISTQTSSGFNVRVTTDNDVELSAAKRGWFLDLPSGGERVVSQAVTVIDNVDSAKNRVVFTTVIPSDDKCDAGGTSWLMEVLFSGQRPASPVFDLNNIEGFDDGELVTVEISPGVFITVPISGIQSTVGIMDTPTWIDKDADVAFKLGSGTSGGVMTIKNKGKGATSGTAYRVYWQQLL